MISFKEIKLWEIGNFKSVHALFNLHYFLILSITQDPTFLVKCTFFFLINAYSPMSGHFL